MADKKSKYIDGLYQQYWLPLRNRLVHLVHDGDLADDIAQDSFLRVNALDDPQNLEFPYAYLYRTALNLIKDQGKAQAVRSRYREMMAANPTANVDMISPEHTAMARQSVTRVSRAIDKLPKKCRRVFLMHKVENMSHQAIADELGISRHAVEKHIMRALARCQDAFEGSFGGHE